MLERGEYFAEVALLGDRKGPLGDLMGAVWANINKYKERQGKVMNKRSRRMDADGSLPLWPTSKR